MSHAEARKSQGTGSTPEKALREADRPLGACFRDHGPCLRKSERNPAVLHSQQKVFLGRRLSVSNQSSEAFSALGSDMVEEIVRNFGRACVSVRGTSMTPAIHPGDFLTIQHINLQEISVGQIVLFSRGGTLITHRVVEKSEGPHSPHLVTRGDRVVHNDSPVSPDELLGRVKFIERGGRRFQPANHPRAPRHLLSRMLRSSDHATSIYLRLAQFWCLLVREGAR